MTINELTETDIALVVGQAMRRVIAYGTPPSTAIEQQIHLETGEFRHVPICDSNLKDMIGAAKKALTGDAA